MRWVSKTCVRVGALLLLSVLAPWLLLAGPRQQDVLPRHGGKQVLDNTVKQAYFYDGGRKVDLFDSGLGIAKIKKDAKLEDANVAATTLAPSSPLRDLQPGLKGAGYVIVNTRGPRSLDMSNVADMPNQVEFALPIVELQAKSDRPAQLVMTLVCSLGSLRI